MKKLLVNTPSGEQHVIEIGEGGGYFEPARVLWDERLDGVLPAISLGGMTRIGNTLQVDAGLLAASTAATQAKEAESARLLGIDSALDGDAQINALKVMTNAEFDTWFDTNINTNAKVIAFVKKLAKVLIRRVF